MRILVAHNFYQSASPSGEDSAFRNELLLLENAGHEVIAYERHNDDIPESLVGRASTALASAWSMRARRDVKALIHKHRPDVAHFHNTFPQISPSAYAACRAHGVPVVQTLHNYRLICPGALLMRDGAPCEQCVGGNLLHGVRHACYRQSRSASAVVAAVLLAHRARRTYTRDVDRYIALTAFARQRFIRGGLPADRIVVRPNCLMDAPAIGTGTGNFALYVGRLSAEKGIRTLVQAWAGMDTPLKIAGDGLLRAELEQIARGTCANIEFLGFRSRMEVLDLMRAATCLVIPSECYEGFPITVLEALATGTPLAVSALGALDEIIEAPRNGIKFSAGNPRSLRDGISRLLADIPLQRQMRQNNRALFENSYSATRGLDSLLQVYAEAVRRLTNTAAASYA